jgi:hypothetical protein
VIKSLFGSRSSFTGPEVPLQTKVRYSRCLKVKAWNLEKDQKKQHDRVHER